MPENPHFKLIDNVLYTASLETIISGTLNELKIVSIPTNVTKIYYDAFAYNSALEEVHIPSSISEIPFYAFCYCDNLRVVKLAEGVKKVSNIAFSGCDLEVLYLPRSITHIEADAFSSEELTVYYAASAEEFKNVEVHERNAALFNAKWHYNYVPA